MTVAVTLPTLAAALSEFFRAHAPDRVSPDPEQRIADGRAFQRALFDAGLAGLSWPVEHGGIGLPSAAEQVFKEIADLYVLPTDDLTLTLRVCAPAILEFGTETQKRRYTRAALRGDHVWCQLWSEPEAGSDLAGVRTTATPDGEGGWVLNGQKVWTSGAHFADFGLALCRTDPEAPKHRGLSMIIVNLRSAGVTVRRLRQITGESHFNEVFLTDVHVPADCVLGAPGQGWPITTWMMGRERVSVGLDMRNANTLTWLDVVAQARRCRRLSDPAVRHKLTELHVRYRAAELFAMRVAQEVEIRTGNAQLSSAVKVAESLVICEAAELAAEIGGAEAIAWAPDQSENLRVATALLASPSTSIAGGTDEIQLNTIGERILGLPPEPRVVPAVARGGADPRPSPPGFVQADP